MKLIKQNKLFKKAFKNKIFLKNNYSTSKNIFKNIFKIILGNIFKNNKPNIQPICISCFWF